MEAAEGLHFGVAPFLWVLSARSGRVGSHSEPQTGFPTPKSAKRPREHQSARLPAHRCAQEGETSALAGSDAYVIRRLELIPKEAKTPHGRGGDIGRLALVNGTEASLALLALSSKTPRRSEALA